MRAKGMGWSRMPLFVWTILVYSYLLILALPAIAAAVTMLLADRHFHTGFFDVAQGETRCYGSICSGSSATPRST